MNRPPITTPAFRRDRNLEVPLPGWPRLLHIPLAAAYTSRTPSFISRLGSGREKSRISLRMGSRVIDIHDLDAWIERQPSEPGR